MTRQTKEIKQLKHLQTSKVEQSHYQDLKVKQQERQGITNQRMISEEAS